MMRTKWVRCTEMTPPCSVTHIEGHVITVRWRDVHPDGWGLKVLPLEEHPPSPETTSSHTDKDIDPVRLTSEVGSTTGLVVRERPEHDGPDAPLIRTVHDPTGALTTEALDAAIVAH